MDCSKLNAALNPCSIAARSDLAELKLRVDARSLAFFKHEILERVQAAAQAAQPETMESMFPDFDDLELEMLTQDDDDAPDMERVRYISTTMRAESDFRLNNRQTLQLADSHLVQESISNVDMQILCYEKLGISITAETAGLVVAQVKRDLQRLKDMAYADHFGTA